MTRRRATSLAVATLGAAALLPPMAASGGAAAKTVAVSVTPANKLPAGKGNGLGSLRPGISTSGRFVVFESYSRRISKRDTNRQDDVYWRDVREKVTHRVSKSTSGRQANAGSGNASVSGDGRLVVFDSSADNLVRRDTNRTRCTSTELEEEGACQREPAGDVFVRNVRKRTTRRISVSSKGRQGNDSSGIAAISGNGRYVVFESRASNLVAGDEGGKTDIFVRDLKRRRTELVSRSSQGAQGDGDCLVSDISDDGRYVAFTSDSTNLVAGDTNDIEDVFVRDRRAKRTVRASVSTAGAESDAIINSIDLSGNGRRVAFATAATTLVPGDTNIPADPDARGQGIDVFVHDLPSRTTRRLSVSTTGAQSTADSGNPSLSDDGRLVAFESEGSDLVPGPDGNDGLSDVFVRTLADDASLRRVSLSSGGALGNGYSVAPALAGNGRYVAFESAASNLAGPDKNDSTDIFRRGPL